MPGLDSNPHRLSLEPLLPATALPFNIGILPRREKATTNRRPSSIHSLVFLWKLEKRNGSPSPTPSNLDSIIQQLQEKKNLLYIERFLLAIKTNKKISMLASLVSISGHNMSVGEVPVGQSRHGHDRFTKSHQSVIPVCRVNFCSIGTPSVFILHLSTQTSLSLHHSFLNN